MKYTVETKCTNEKCDFVIKRLPITNTYKSECDILHLDSFVFRLKCPKCNTFFDVNGKEEVYDQRVLVSKGDMGTKFGFIIDKK